VNAIATAVLATNLSKTYQLEDTSLDVLNDVNFTVKKGEFVVVTGASGCGKTTLLNIISGIDKPTNGEIAVFGEKLTGRNESFLATFRCNTIGFVFQSYNLVSTLTVGENVAFPMEWLRKPTEEIQKRVAELLDMVGLQNRIGHFPHQLSGGEQQRVAFARALANDPPLLLIDEPTGNLDEKISKKIIDIMKNLKQEKRTVIVATHDSRIVELADRKWLLEDGKLADLNE
jgi:putative ABC transport system ATP-binding protein